VTIKLGVLSWDLAVPWDSASQNIKNDGDDMIFFNK